MHTPGPWRHDGRFIHQEAERTETRVAYVYGVFGERTPDEQQANAHLIAAAPEMGKLLMQAIGLMPIGTGVLEKWRKEAIEVVEKAGLR